MKNHLHSSKLAFSLITSLFIVLLIVSLSKSNFDIRERAASGEPTISPSGTPASINYGDINHDGIINIQDFILLSNAFNTSNTDCDLNNDGVVNIQDFIILSNNFGKTLTKIKTNLPIITPTPPWNPID